MTLDDPRYVIVGLGESLYDVFGAEHRLGGAPLNAAIHAHRLGRAYGGRGELVSRIGQDRLGDRLVGELSGAGLGHDYVQSDPDRPTGRVYVTTDRDGQPTYEIPHNQAWDNLQQDPDLDALAHVCSAVAFGSLAQRDAQARFAIRRFLDEARQAVRLFDVNLRLDFYDAKLIDQSCERATVVKLNDEELPLVARLTHLDAGDDDPAAQLAELISRYRLDLVVFTRGKQGTRLVTSGETIDGAPATADRHAEADSVGAGDSVTAAVLTGLCLGRPLKVIADAANRVGAYVANQPGATPELPDELLHPFD